MLPKEYISPAPVPSEVPEYVWKHQYDRPCILAGRPSEKPKDTSVKFNHPNVESALKAAKAACRKRPGRRYGSNVVNERDVSFLVYENGKVIERHMALWNGIKKSEWHPPR